MPSPLTRLSLNHSAAASQLSVATISPDSATAAFRDLSHAPQIPLQIFRTVTAEMSLMPPLDLGSGIATASEETLILLATLPSLIEMHAKLIFCLGLLSAAFRDLNSILRFPFSLAILPLRDRAAHAPMLPIKSLEELTLSVAASEMIMAYLDHSSSHLIAAFVNKMPPTLLVV